VSRSTSDKRTQLIGKNFPASCDREALAVIHSLPAPDAGEGLWVVGVADPAGRVYRRVQLFSAIELLHFTARMNAAGFAQWRGVRRTAYESVFVKTRRQGQAPRFPY
jgi:hypothetical protein